MSENVFFLEYFPLHENVPKMDYEECTLHAHPKPKKGQVLTQPKINAVTKGKALPFPSDLIHLVTFRVNTALHLTLVQWSQIRKQSISNQIVLPRIENLSFASDSYIFVMMHTSL